MADEIFNPFTDEKLNESPVNIIRDRESMGLSDTTVAIRLPDPKIENKLKVYFIEWDFLHGHQNDEKYRDIKYIVQGLWMNGYPLIESGEVISCELLEKKIASAPYPRKPKAKLDNILLDIAKHRNEDGKDFTYNLGQPQKLFFKSKKEAHFYLKTLNESGLIKLYEEENNPNCYSLELTFKGLSYLVDLEDEGISSSRCFIAISFAEEMSIYRDAIVEIVKYHGYEPIIVNSDFVVKNDMPVIDEILSGIKRSKFCISDFTMQRSGVYFEAGYALGLGKPVIYLSERNDFDKNSHFDLRPFQHILYSDVEGLKNALRVKIAAWIGSLNPEYK